MCITSYVGDGWRDRIPDVHPWVEPIYPTQPYSPKPIDYKPYKILQTPTREEFEALKKEIQELKELLKAAQKFDAATNQPHCEQEDKVLLIKKLAEYVGVDMKDVFKE